MRYLIVEIKARCADPERIRRILHKRGADFRGTDHQKIDTYFSVAQGRLKIREGNIEKALIHYQRDDQPSPKDSRVTIYRPGDIGALKQVLTAALGTRVVVDKKRKIYFVDNVKLHIDSVVSLGSFVEIEAIDEDGTIGRDALLRQCRDHMSLLGVMDEDLVSGSYSDMLLQQQAS